MYEILQKALVTIDTGNDKRELLITTSDVVNMSDGRLLLITGIEKLNDDSIVLTNGNNILPHSEIIDIYRDIEMTELNE